MSGASPRWIRVSAAGDRGVEAGGPGRGIHGVEQPAPIGGGCLVQPVAHRVGDQGPQRGMGPRAGLGHQQRHQGCRFEDRLGLLPEDPREGADRLGMFVEDLDDVMAQRDGEVPPVLTNMTFRTKKYLW